ncbi:hypothetical protein PW52_06455 [Tamlana sedimentorum]|uniref:Chloroplast import component protein (Tic20) n=1 Tax=Neotamlana sedimentorum TaxID=1435349 RepID=A0A0D7WC16_9FLAO|nr:hypothetical protein [Tamlana sedimentorum]KJD36233.1 hypothetical protein PW52_06455 [Tamlana sedimentorum]
MTNQDIQEGKTLGIVAYLTFIGLIYSIFKNIDKKNPFIAFHCRQMLGLILMLIFSNITEKYVNSWLGTVCWYITFACWIYSLIIASKGETKLIPYLGKLFQDWFANIGK